MPTEEEQVIAVSSHESQEEKTNPSMSATEEVENLVNKRI